MTFNLVYLSISGLIVFGLFLRTIWVIVRAWENRNKLWTEIDEAREFLSTVKSFQNEIDKANVTVQNVFITLGHTDKEKVFAEDLKEQGWKEKKPIMKYPFKYLSRGVDSTSYEAVIDENKVSLLWKMDIPGNVATSKKSYVNRLIDACRDVHIEQFYSENITLQEFKVI